MRTLWNAMADIVGRVATSGEREGGQTLAEYSLILAFLAVGAIDLPVGSGCGHHRHVLGSINRVFNEVLSLF